MKTEEKKQKEETEWILCSKNWRDIVITYVPNLNDILLEENYAEIPLEQFKKTYKWYQRRLQMKRKK